MFRALVFVGLGLLADVEVIIHGLEYLLNRLVEALDHILDLIQ